MPNCPKLTQNSKLRILKSTNSGGKSSARKNSSINSKLRQPTKNKNCNFRTTDWTTAWMILRKILDNTNPSRIKPSGNYRPRSNNTKKDVHLSKSYWQTRTQKLRKSKTQEKKKSSLPPFSRISGNLKFLLPTKTARSTIFISSWKELSLLQPSRKVKIGTIKCWPGIKLLKSTFKIRPSNFKNNWPSSKCPRGKLLLKLPSVAISKNYSGTRSNKIPESKLNLNPKLRRSIIWKIQSRSSR